jgi:hypothetical protein
MALTLNMLQPHFEASVMMKLTLPKVGTWSPPWLPKIQSLIVGVKTPCIEMFFIPSERSWSVDVQNGLAWTIWTSTGHVMGKRRVGSQTATTKSRESTRHWCVQVECDTPLKSSQGKLQVCLRLHPNRRSEQEVMNAQSLGSLNRNNFGTPLWESREKVPFRCKCGRVTQRILYGGRWWLSPNPGRGE